MIRKEVVSIYFAGLVQGITLIAFPAASTIFTNSQQFNFSNTEYGSLFIPQAIISIAASALNPALCRCMGTKHVYLGGLVSNFFSMLLLAVSAVLMKDHDAAYATLLFATGFLGLGFGLVVPSVNSMAALMYPSKEDASLLTLNALLGIGTTLAPVFISIFVGFGIWWGLPVLLAALLLCLFLFSAPLALPGGKIKLSAKSSHSSSVPSRFWIFALVALLYGIIETLNGNWVSIFMKKDLHASQYIQYMALTAFWGMVTFGRIFYALIEKVFPARFAFQISPFIAMVAFIIIFYLPSHAENWGIFAFALGGFGCSALLPLIISFGSRQLAAFSLSVPGMVISFYLLLDDQVFSCGGKL